MSDSSTAAPPALGQKLTAEFLGTFVLVFFGVGSVVILGAAGGQIVDLTGIALAFGIAVMVMVYAVGRISGGHFNPAVSIGAAIGGRVSWNEAFAYMVTQVVGATAGAFALFVVAQGFPGFTAKGRMGANSFGSTGSGISWWAALVLELILTAIFVFVILAVTDSRNEHPALAPLAIGFTLVAIHLVAIPATGTSVNPARSIGPAIFGGGDALEAAVAVHRRPAPRRRPLRDRLPTSLRPRRGARRRVRPAVRHAGRRRRTGVRRARPAPAAVAAGGHDAGGPAGRSRRRRADLRSGRSSSQGRIIRTRERSDGTGSRVCCATRPTPRAKNDRTSRCGPSPLASRVVRVPR